jgi:membrane protease YdiL (CAAX protease family)
MRTVVTFLASLALHAALAAALLAGLLRLNDVRSPAALVISGVYLALVGALGLLKAARWGGYGTLAYVLGLAMAVLAATFVVATVAYAMTYPVGPAPPFSEYLAQVAASRNGLLWLAAPIVLSGVAAMAGHAAGARLAGSRVRNATA